MSDKTSDTKLAKEIAHLDRIEAEARQRLGDPCLTFIDIAVIALTAKWFGVTETAAYLRAKSLELLSYQNGKEPSHAG